MKFTGTFLATILITINSLAQTVVPGGINYQAVARDASGAVLADKLITLRITISGGSANSTPQYVETHSVTTSNLGMFTLTIGGGTPREGSFQEIPWKDANHWLKVELDAEGGNNFIVVGASQLLSVPYAFYAVTAGNVEGDVSAEPVDQGSRAGDDWLLVGNSGLTAGTNFVGTTDAVDLVTKTNNTERMRVTSGGKVGVGSTSPVNLLHVKGENTHTFAVEAATVNPGIDFIEGGNFRSQIRYNLNSNGLTFVADNAYSGTGSQISDLKTGLFISGVNQNVGIGTHFPNEELHIMRNDGGKIAIQLSGKTTGGVKKHAFIRMDPNTNNFLYFENSGNKMGITSSGNVGIGTTNPTYKLHVNGTFKSNGITESSDIRWKKNIRPLENALDKVLALRGVSFEWKKDDAPEMNFEKGIQIGLIAQEVEKVLPELVDTDSEGYKSVQYSKLVPLLLEAIREQQAMISAQGQAIAASADKIAALQSALNLVTAHLESLGLGNYNASK